MKFPLLLTAALSFSNPNPPDGTSVVKIKTISSDHQPYLDGAPTEYPAISDMANRLVVHVLTSAGSPIPGMTVELVNTDTGESRKYPTSEKGFVAFEGFSPSGSYAALVFAGRKLVHSTTLVLVPGPNSLIISF